MPESILSLVIFSPLLGIAILSFLKEEEHIKWTSAIITLITFVLSAPLMWYFNTNG